MYEAVPGGPAGVPAGAAGALGTIKIMGDGPDERYLYLSDILSDAIATPLTDRIGVDHLAALT